SHFTRFKVGRSTALPTHIEGGPWLSRVGNNNTLTAKLVRGITSHAPIGEYRRRIWKDPDKNNWKCSCGYHDESFYHIYHCCYLWSNHCETFKDRSSLLCFIRFLQANPGVLQFPNQQNTREFQLPPILPVLRGRAIILDKLGQPALDLL